MVRKLIQWSLDNPLFAILMAVGLAVAGVYSFLNINVEAYPDPAPPTVEIVTIFPARPPRKWRNRSRSRWSRPSPGMPGLASMHTKTVFGLSDIKIFFDYGVEYKEARQETLNCLQSTRNCRPASSRRFPRSRPPGEIYRYWLRAPKNAADQNIYTLNDLKALQDWVLEREFRSVPRVVDVTSWGGTVRRYEVQPDPDRMRRYGITLAQLQAALANSNATVGGDYVKQGDVAMTVRSVGLFGGGEDPVRKVLGMTDPAQAARVLRSEEERRLREIRSLVITSVNNQPVRVEDVVEGGRLIERWRTAGGPRRARRRTRSRRVPPDPPGDDGALPGEARRLRIAFSSPITPSALAKSARTIPTRWVASSCFAREKRPCPP